MWLLIIALLGLKLNGINKRARARISAAMALAMQDKRFHVFQEGDLNHVHYING